MFLYSGIILYFLYFQQLKFAICVPASLSTTSNLLQPIIATNLSTDSLAAARYSVQGTPFRLQIKQDLHEQLRLGSVVSMLRGVYAWCARNIRQGQGFESITSEGHDYFNSTVINESMQQGWEIVLILKTMAGGPQGSYLLNWEDLRCISDALVDWSNENWSQETQFEHWPPAILVLGFSFEVWHTRLGIVGWGRVASGDDS